MKSVCWKINDLLDPPSMLLIQTVHIRYTETIMPTYAFEILSQDLFFGRFTFTFSKINIVLFYRPQAVRP